jgi:hypothetical protein
LYDHTGLSLPAFEDKIRKIDDISSPYIEKATNVIDAGLDTAIKTSSDLFKLTKKQLKKLSSEEKLLFHLVKTWVTALWQSGFSQGFHLSLPDFMNAVNQDSSLQGQIDKIKEKVAIFYEVATGAWKKLLEKNKKDIRRVIIEISASTLCVFAGIQQEKEAFIAELVNTGDNVMDNSKAVDITTSESFVLKVETQLGQRLPSEHQAYLDVAKKFYNVLVQFQKILHASESLSEYMIVLSASKWVKYFASGGEIIIGGVEGVVNKLHTRFVHESKSVNEAAISPATRTTYLVRIKSIAAKLNEIRRAMLEDLTNRDLAKDAKLMFSKLQTFVQFLTLATIRAVDTVYIPLQAYTVSVLKRPEVVAVKVFVAREGARALKLLETHPALQRLRKEAAILYQKGSIQFRIRYSRAMIYSKELKDDIERFIVELYTLIKEQEDKKQIPGKMYKLALEAIKKRQQRGRQLTASAEVKAT